MYIVGEMRYIYWNAMDMMVVVMMNVFLWLLDVMVSSIPTSVIIHCMILQKCAYI